MIDKLIEEALKVKELSYSPYSKFKVGAALLTKNGRIYTGCNIENASFTPTICAERVAIFKAVSSGDLEIEAIAIVGDKDNTFPCGVCRQVIREFNEHNIDIYIVNKDKSYSKYKLEDLLPNSFGPEYI